MGSYRWVDDPGAFADAVRELQSADVNTIDTEFHRERSYYPHLALVQLGWADQVALVDPLVVDLHPLAAVLDGPGLAVLHAADQDLEVLERACGTIPARLFDTQVAAGFVGMSSPSLVNLVERVLGRRLPKGDRLTDWTRRPLTEDQKSYAASDVEHLIDIYEHLRDDLESRGRLRWAELECEELRQRSRQPQDPDTAWWRLKESRQLRGKARGVAQALAAWRERRAASLDIPPRFVLSDLAVVAIANRPPTKAADLDNVRGLDSRSLKGDVLDRLLEAVRAGRELADGELRVPPVDELDRRLRPAVTLVSAWVSQLASDLEIEQALLATRSDLHSFLRGDPDARLAGGWRDELVGAPVRQLVEGQAALAFDGHGGLALERRSYDPVSTTAPGPDTVPE
jgi:ribonuclease D